VRIGSASNRGPVGKLRVELFYAKSVTRSIANSVFCCRTDTGAEDSAASTIEARCIEPQPQPPITLVRNVLRAELLSYFYQTSFTITV